MAAQFFSLNDLTKQLNDRGSFLARNDPLYQSIHAKIEMEKVRLNDMFEFTQMMEKKPDEQSGPGTSKKVRKKTQPGKTPATNPEE